MSDARAYLNALEHLKENKEQFDAVHESKHCVVLAGPGSGKTKTLTTAIAKTLLIDVAEPRGIACITYNNDCVLELRARLNRLGVQEGRRVFIGTVHSFALTQVIMPYARAVFPELPVDIRVATDDEQDASKKRAYLASINEGEDPLRRWKFAEEKRKRCINRDGFAWLSATPDLTRFIESYEADLRRQGLIDFEDMPLLAVKAIKAYPWVRNALHARFPHLFVDEYQDLGYALDELVQELCFNAGIRLFAVGDADQSIYGFTGANPELLKSLTSRSDVETYRLKFNYRSGRAIIAASMAALASERDYQARVGAVGEVFFSAVEGGLVDQARCIADTIIPMLTAAGIRNEEIAVLYRSAGEGDTITAALRGAGIPFVRSDKSAIVPRGSRLARFIESCAVWVTGGWKTGEPRYRNVLNDAITVVFGRNDIAIERLTLSRELIMFLLEFRGSDVTAGEWLTRFREDVLKTWQKRASGATNDWDVVDQMLMRMSPENEAPLSLAYFAGRIGESGRVNLSTLHSSKGREFDAVILAALDAGVSPNNYDVRTPQGMNEARRLFYVGITRSRTHLHLVYNKSSPSMWIPELAARLNEA